MPPRKERIVKIGFTGSQRGLTSKQNEDLFALLKRLNPELGVHGACIGADDLFDQLCAKLGISRAIFPSTNLSKRVPDAELISRSGSVCTIYPAKPGLERNADIVNLGAALIACPRQSFEIVRSGTWATVRLARRLGKPIHLLLP